MQSACVLAWHNAKSRKDSVVGAIVAADLETFRRTIYRTSRGEHFSGAVYGAGAEYCEQYNTSFLVATDRVVGSWCEGKHDVWKGIEVYWNSAVFIIEEEDISIKEYDKEPIVHDCSVLEATDRVANRLADRQDGEQDKEYEKEPIENDCSLLVDTDRVANRLADIGGSSGWSAR